MTLSQTLSLSAPQLHFSRLTGVMIRPSSDLLRSRFSPFPLRILSLPLPGFDDPEKRIPPIPDG